jgi:hypothetical protein
MHDPEVQPWHDKAMHIHDLVYSKSTGEYPRSLRSVLLIGYSQAILQYHAAILLLQAQRTLGSAVRQFMDILNFLDKLAYEEGRMLLRNVKSSKRIEAQRRRWWIAHIILDDDLAALLLKKVRFYARTEKERDLLSDDQLREIGLERRNPTSPEAEHYRQQKERKRISSLPKSNLHKARK